MGSNPIAHTNEINELLPNRKPLPIQWGNSWGNKRQAFTPPHGVENAFGKHRPAKSAQLGFTTTPANPASAMSRPLPARRMRTHLSARPKVESRRRLLFASFAVSTAVALAFLA
jgi:hypothetical protein